MVSALRIVASLGLAAFAQANGQDCQQNNCLRQFQQSRQVTQFCATYTTAVVTQTTDYPYYVSQCSGNTAKISSACSCVVTEPPPSQSRCEPVTVTVTWIPPVQTYTTTENFTSTLTKTSTVTTDIYFSTTIISDIYISVTKTETSTTTTEEPTTTTTTLEETTTETDTTTTTTISISDSYITDTTTTTTISTSDIYVTDTTTATTISTSDIYITDTTTTTTISTSDIYITDTTTTTTISISDSFITDITTTTVPTTATTISVSESDIIVDVPTTVVETDTVTETDIETATEVEFTTLPASTITTSISGTLTTITEPGATITNVVDIPTTATEIEVTTLPASTITTSISGTLTTITEPGATVTNVVDIPTTATAPGQITTLPGIITVETVTTILPGVVTTEIAAGIVTTITLPGVTNVITTTVTLPGVSATLPGIPTTFPPVTITVTTGIVTCPGPTPTTKLATALPTDYTWGCPPGSVCHPPKPQGCDVFAEPPPNDYVCQPSECVASPPFTRVTEGWGNSIFSNSTSFFPLQEDYFNLSPLAFGLSFDIFTENLEVLHVPGGLTTITTGDWNSQASITAQPTPDAGGSPAKMIKRSVVKRFMNKRPLYRRSSTVPAPCYNECNNCYIEAQQEGKSSALCNMQPLSPFMSDLAACNACVAAHGDATQQSLKTYVDPEFAQYLDFCNGVAAQSAVTQSSTPLQTEISPGPTVSQSVVSVSQQAPASSTPIPSSSSSPSPTPTSMAAASPITPTSSATSTANAIQTSSTEPSPTSSPPPSATTSLAQVTGSGSSLDPAGIFLLALTTVLTAVLSVLT